MSSVPRGVIVSVLVVLALAVPALSTTALAGGSLATVQLDSVPPGARVVVRSHTVGTTPTRLQVPADRPFSFTLRKRGYLPERVNVGPLRPGQVRQMAIPLRPR